MLELGEPWGPEKKKAPVTWTGEEGSLFGAHPMTSPVCWVGMRYGNCVQDKYCHGLLA